MKLPEKVVIDRHLPSGYVIRGYTELQMIQAIKYALEKAAQYENEAGIYSKHDMAEAIRRLKENV